MNTQLTKSTGVYGISFGFNCIFRSVYGVYSILIRRLSDKKKLTPNVTVDDSPGIGDYRFESDKSECRTSENAEHFSSTPGNYWANPISVQSGIHAPQGFYWYSSDCENFRISDRTIPGPKKKSRTKRCVDP